MPDQATVFTFELDSFKITDTRSRHEDTDYASFTLRVNPHNGTGTPQTLTKSIGNVNNGVHAVGLTFPKITVHPTDTVVVNYLIVNSGHKKPTEVESTLEAAGTKLTGMGAAAIGAAVGSAIPGFGTLLGGLAGLLSGEINNLLNADCDGPVAAEQHTFTYADLVAKTAHGKFTQTTDHHGTNSPHGCGGNSRYYVTWHVQHG